MLKTRRRSYQETLVPLPFGGLGQSENVGNICFFCRGKRFWLPVVNMIRQPQRYSIKEELLELFASLPSQRKNDACPARCSSRPQDNGVRAGNQRSRGSQRDMNPSGRARNLQISMALSWAHSSVASCLMRLGHYLLTSGRTIEQLA